MLLSTDSMPFGMQGCCITGRKGCYLPSYCTWAHRHPLATRESTPSLSPKEHGKFCFRDSQPRMAGASSGFGWTLFCYATQEYTLYDRSHFSCIIFLTLRHRGMVMIRNEQRSSRRGAPDNEVEYCFLQQIDSFLTKMHFFVYSNVSFIVLAFIFVVS